MFKFTCSVDATVTMCTEDWLVVMNALAFAMESPDWRKACAEFIGPPEQTLEVLEVQLEPIIKKAK